MAPALVSIGGMVGPPARNEAEPGGYKEFATIGYKDLEVKGGNGFAPASYPHYLPTWTVPKSGVYPPLQPFEHYEHGRDADPSFPNLLPESADHDPITPHFGSEVSGIQLSKLSNAGKDELALFVAQRGVVAFRDQDFADLPIQEALDFASYFGRLHIHPSSGAPEGYPHVHLVHRGADEPDPGISVLEQRTSSVAWHSDVSYERQPPGTTFLYALDLPAVSKGKYAGGDTAFVSQVRIYERLSKPFRERLEGLRAVHSGVEQAEASKARGGVVRRNPITSEHPLVRTHPATGQKALYVNPQFTRYIVGYKKEESDALLKFLYDHIAFSTDAQCRLRWKPKTVVVWDNRITAHSALLDWGNGERRHMARLTPQAEAPRE